MTKKDKLLVLIADDFGGAASVNSLLHDYGKQYGECLDKTGFASVASFKDAFYSLHKDGYLKKLEFSGFSDVSKGHVFILSDKGTIYANALIKAVEDEKHKPRQMDLFENPAEKTVEKSLDEKPHSALEDLVKAFDSVLSDLQKMRELHAVPSAGWVDITCSRMLRAKQKVVDIIESAMQLAG